MARRLKLVGAPGLVRPQPPAEVLDPFGLRTFVPAPEVEEWARAAFIDGSALLVNEEHMHLRFAQIGFLWSGIGNARLGKRIVGQCEQMPPRAMGRWQKGRAEQQLVEWFGFAPDFLITLDANYAAECDDASFMSLCEHELLHAGQAADEFGNPKFNKDTGRPIFSLRGHDVEEFVSIVERYGPGAAAGATQALVEAAMKPPSIAQANIAQACGTCLARAA